MIEGFLDDKRQNPSNKLDLAFFWSLVKEEGKDVCTMYQKLLIRLGIMEEEREEVYIEQVWQPLAGFMFLCLRFSFRSFDIASYIHCNFAIVRDMKCIKEPAIAEIILRLQ